MCFISTFNSSGCSPFALVKCDGAKVKGEVLLLKIASALAVRVQEDTVARGEFLSKSVC